MRKIMQIAVGAYLLFVAAANAGDKTHLRIDSEMVAEGRSTSKSTAWLVEGETATQTINGAQGHPQLVMTFKPVGASDGDVTLETVLSINRMKDTPGRTLDRQIYQMTVQGKVGETTTIDSFPGAKYKWTSRRVSKEEFRTAMDRLLRNDAGKQ